MDITKVAGEPPRMELRLWFARTGHRRGVVGRAIGVSDSVMSDYMNGRYDLQIDKTVALAELTGIPPERLVADPKTSAALKRIRTSPKSKSPRAPRKPRNV